MRQVDAAHLLRRFGLGATLAETATLHTLTDDQAVGHVLDFGEDDGFNIHPFELFYDNNGQFQNQVGRATAWWLLRMVMTKKPAVDKLTLFWHDHFATSGEKVTNGLVMLQHLRTLRTNAAKPFDELLRAVSTDPAMLVWLDGQTSVKGKPNENFARELLELFTLGIGHYSEKDVQEAARAFTGWSLRTIPASPNDERGRLRQLVVAARTDDPLVYATFAHGLHDSAEKSVLGKTARFTTDSMLEHVASHSETARHLARKLWEYYAYPEPEKTVVDRVAKEWKVSGGDPVRVLNWIAKSDEFWSKKARRAIVKSPIDFVIPLVRQLDARGQLLAQRKPDADPETPLAQPLRTLATGLATTLNRLGMVPLFPPDVAGWNWGTSWISTSTVLDRLRFVESIAARPEGGAGLVVKDLATSGAAETSEAAVLRILEMFDAGETGGQTPVLVQALERRGGKSVLTDARKAAPAIMDVMRLLGAMPSFQYC